MQIKSLHKQLYTILRLPIDIILKPYPFLIESVPWFRNGNGSRKGGLQTRSVSALYKKRKRSFAKGHAQLWTFKPYQDMVIGERIQIDHMTVTKNGITVKHFQAWDRVSKYIYANVYSHAKSTSAKRFLFELVETVPFKILSIQVDGGSEFRAEFEAACAELGIPLLILPPRKPQYKGGVERSNRIFQEEFYANPNLLADSIGHIRL